MATTLSEIAGFLEAEGLNFDMFQEPDYPRIVASFKTEHYRNEAGEAQLTILFRLSHENENLMIYAPTAFKIAPDNMAGTALACCIVQYHTNAIQFEIDHEDGEIRPTVELPLADALLTHKQLMMALGILLAATDMAADLLRHAAKTGEIDLALYRGVGGDRTVEQLSNLLSEFTPEQIERAVGLRLGR